MIDVLLVWVALFGLWPLLDPGHALTTVASVVDVIAHGAACWALCRRWKLVRR